MKKPVKTVCSRCGGKGWSKEWWGWGIMVSSHSPLWKYVKQVLQCPWCELPEDAPPMKKVLRGEK